MRRLSTNNIDKLNIPHMIRLLYGSLVRPKRRQIMYNTTPITGVYASALSALGIEPASGTQAPIAALDKLCKKAFGGEKAVAILAQDLLDKGDSITLPYVDTRSSEIKTIIAEVLGEMFLNGAYTPQTAASEMRARIENI